MLLNILAAAGWSCHAGAVLPVVTTYAHSRTKLLVGIRWRTRCRASACSWAEGRSCWAGTADFGRTTAVAFFLLQIILMVIWMVNSHERKAPNRRRAADELLGFRAGAGERAQSCAATRWSTTTG
ncbi:MAG: hypothetical protein ACLT98_11700 [Eggerthellaceae bacterium]